MKPVWESLSPLKVGHRLSIIAALDGLLFCYNVGSGNLQKSSLRMKLNRGDIEGASAEFPKWRRSAGRILPGLVRRRVAERRLFEAV